NEVGGILMKYIWNKVQYSIYSTMLNPDSNRLPVIYEDWVELAREKLLYERFYYIAGGAGGEQTMSANLKAFADQKIIPQMLRNVEERDLSVSLFGKTYPSPILQAPIGVQSIIHPDGEVASALASAELDVPYI